MICLYMQCSYRSVEIALNTTLSVRFPHAPEDEFDELGPHVVVAVTLGAVVPCVRVALNPLTLDLSDANILHSEMCAA